MGIHQQQMENKILAMKKSIFLITLVWYPLLSMHSSFESGID